MRKPLNPVTARLNQTRTRGAQYSGRALYPEISHMHPEGRLLVLCARTTINSFVRVEVEDLVGEAIDWEEVWRLSKAHGVAPLVYGRNRHITTLVPKTTEVSIWTASGQRTRGKTSPYARSEIGLAGRLKKTQLKLFGAGKGDGVSFGETGVAVLLGGARRGF